MDVEKIATPNSRGIDEVSEFLNISPKRQLKLYYTILMGKLLQCL